uniref:Uncharacterized protein n=1 Tax=Cajanus cajan TaxID=3821 RepID=A0A151UCB1_CAJCA|nr:hypothetical protein KK1_021223 [Cajanus cajan]
MLNSFWWGSNRHSGKGIHWLSWEKLSMSKEHGGMGFRNLYGFNLAMLGKHGWKFLTNQDAIVTCVFKAKYFPRGDFLGANLGHNPSFTWRSIHASQVVVRGGMRWCIGNGLCIKPWVDPLLRQQGKPSSRVYEEIRIADLIDFENDTWKFDLINRIFNQHDIDAIKDIPLLQLDEADTFMWNLNRKGSYSVKSAYYLIMESLLCNFISRVPGDWKKLWALPISHNMKILLWRLLRDCLPSRQHL